MLVRFLKQISSPRSGTTALNTDRSIIKHPFLLVLPDCSATFESHPCTLLTAAWTPLQSDVQKKCQYLS